MRIRAVLCCLFMVTTGVTQSYRPKAGYVPDSGTAITVAEAVLIPVYGADKIASERPFTATLRSSVWIVGGTLHCRGAKGEMTTGCDGGLAAIKIAKSDARILSLIHGK